MIKNKFLIEDIIHITDFTPHKSDVTSLFTAFIDLCQLYYSIVYYRFDDVCCLLSLIEHICK